MPDGGIWRRERAAGQPGPYPERADETPNWVDRKLSEIYGLMAPRCVAPFGAWQRQAMRIERRGEALAAETDARLGAVCNELRVKLRRNGLAPALIVEAFALVREVSARRLGLRHHRVQLIGGLALLGGRLAEMATGEGKTITAALPAVTAALAGIPVHLVTVNDYLAGRDRDTLREIYAAFGLSVGLIQHEMDPDSRRAAYACDVAYCTNKELAFDYLRDRIALAGRPAAAALLLDRLQGRDAAASGVVLRGLHFAIVDEADSVLIDEARTPLIIAGEARHQAEPQSLAAALATARALEAGADFTLAPGERLVRLTKVGRARLDAAFTDRRGMLAARRAREEIVEQALSALHLFQRDTHYIVAEGKVQIVDEYTGRVMEGRSWERGLQQLIETKEGVELTGRHETLAKITYQRFFRRYLRLAGMTGTASETAAEMWATYGLRVARIPTDKPVRRRGLGTTLARTRAAKWAAVVAGARGACDAGRAVLIGTRSVEASEEVAAALAAAGIAHVVLNARQDRDEAAIVAGAGQSGRVTVATNMAGRGTDIRLEASVAAAGGLHVILTEFHDSGRIDRQLYGRAGRQGDRGSFEAVIALDDELFLRFAPRLSSIAGRLGAPFSSMTGVVLKRLAQAKAERLHAAIRRQTVRDDRQSEKTLGFAKVTG